MKARILTFDVENMGLRGWAWGLYEQNIIHVDHPQHMLCIAYKWLDEKKVHTTAIWDFPLYKKDKHNDKALAEHFWPILDEADVVIGHNINQFDIKMVNSMFMRHGMKPPSPYKTVDTKKVAKSTGRFPSNKLDDLGEDFGIGKKMKHQGFPLWLDCDEGDKKAHKKMLKYNIQDVRLTEKLYLELRPWVKNHPSINVLEKRPDSCPSCAGSKMHKSIKYRSTKTGTLKQYYRCADCGAMAESRIPEPNTEKMLYVN